jgi:hypothetical protein
MGITRPARDLAAGDANYLSLLDAADVTRRAKA